MLKKIVKKMIMVCTVLALFGTMGIFVDQPNKAYAAENSKIGVVDYLFLIDNHPDTMKSNELFKTEYEQARKTFEEKAVDMNDQDKKTLENTLNKQVEQKRQELFREIANKVNAGIKAVADTNGFMIVLPKNDVIYGGQDITNLVMKKIKG